MSTSRAKLHTAIRLYTGLIELTSHAHSKEAYQAEISHLNKVLKEMNEPLIEETASEIDISKLEEITNKRLLHKFENGKKRLSGLSSCLSDAEYIERLNTLNRLYKKAESSHHFSDLSQFIDHMETDLTDKINESLDREERTSLFYKPTIVPEKQNEQYHLLKRLALAKKRYETLAELCPDKRKLYLKESEKLSDADPTLDKLNKLITYLEYKIRLAETSQEKENRRQMREYALKASLFGLDTVSILMKNPPVITRSKINQALDDIHFIHIRAESLIIFFECYIKLKTHSSHFFKNNTAKISLADKLLELIKYNEKITITCAELALLIDSTGLKGSLLKQMVSVFYPIKELSGLRQAVNLYCVQNKKGLYQLDKKINRHLEIQIDHKNVYRRPEPDPDPRLHDDDNYQFVSASNTLRYF